MSEGKEKRKIPKVRFPSFTDDWEQRKLLDCIQKITDFRGRTPKKLGMDWSEEGYLALSALNVKDGYIDFNQDVHYGNQELYDKWMTGNELHKGQVLFTTEAPMGNVAQVPDNRRYILSQRVIALDVKDNLLTENFLATVLRTPTVFAYLTALSSGGTAKGVSQKSLSSVEIRLPKNLKEQEKIADTFSNLDHLITLHQRKLDDLKELKKGMRQRLFPKDGKNIPDLRFPGFNGAWERHTLNDVAKYRNGKAHENDIDAAGAYVVVNSKFVSTNGTVQKFSNKQIEPLFKNEIAFVLSDVPNGRAIARTFLVDKDNTYTLNQRIAGITPLKNADPYFLYILMNRNPYFLKFDDGVKQTNLSVKDVMQFVSFYPTYEEQKIIGEYFENLDNLLLLQQKKINDLLELKKGLLQQMFV